MLNEVARSASAESGAVIATLRELGFHVVHAETPVRASAAKAVREHARQVDLVVAGGGDGTLNAVLQGLVGTHLPLGILPLGTANDLAKTLGIPTDLREACGLIARGRTRRIDVGRVNDAYFFNEASVGMSVALCRRLSREAKSKFGVFALLGYAFRIVLEMRRFRALITLETGEVVASRTAQLTIGNGQNFGGFLTSDDAEIDDRKLDLYSVELNRWWAYFEAVYAILRKRYDEARTVFTLHGKRFEVKTGRPMRIEADGELVTSTPATFEVIPSAVEVFVPAPSPDGGSEA